MDKVLIIDDDEEMCMELKEILTDEGYKVSVAMDGYTGKNLTEQGSFDAIILDLKLPCLDGYGVLKAIRQSGQDVCIVVLSGRPLGENALINQSGVHQHEEEILVLADAVMNKPVMVEALIRQLKECIDKKRNKVSD